MTTCSVGGWRTHSTSDNQSYCRKSQTSLHENSRPTLRLPETLAKLLALILNLRIHAPLIQWTKYHTRFHLSARSETTVPCPAHQGLKRLIVSKADRSADRTVLSTVTPSCFLFRTANLNSRSQQTSNNLTSAFKQQKARQKRTWTYSSFFTEKLSNRIYKCNILK